MDESENEALLRPPFWSKRRLPIAVGILIVIGCLCALIIPLARPSPSEPSSNEPPSSPPPLDESTFSSEQSPTRCSIAVLGAGFAGVYAAYQLSLQYGYDLCLIEAQDRVGGRVYDISPYPGGPRFGIGALRVTETQKTILALAKELGVVLQLQDSDVEMLRVRGQYFYRDLTHRQSDSRLMCQRMFPTLNCSRPTDTDSAMFEMLLDMYHKDPQGVVARYPDFISFIVGVFGDEGLAFLRESVRYNSDFKAGLSVHAMMDFLTQELTDTTDSHPGQDPDRYYPVGGMSQYIDRMMDRIYKHSRVYLSQPVTAIEVQGTSYVITTTKQRIVAERVLCAIDPLRMRDLSGSVAQAIQRAPEFKNIMPQKLSIVTAWWPYRWWEESKLYRNLSRLVSHANSFSVSDLPSTQYARDQNVSRAVYDDGVAVELWETLTAAGASLEVLARTVVDSLQQMFPDITVPLPLHLHGFVWDNAWHFQRSTSKTNNQRIFDWALDPLPGRTNFWLVGEGYNLNYTAWCDGAMKSAMWVLARHFDFKFPCLNDPGSPAECNTTGLLRDSPRVYRSIHALMP